VIRFSAFLVAVAVVLLVVGVVTSALVLVYLAIGVSAVALLVLAAGTLSHRDELFGKPANAEPAAVGSGQPQAHVRVVVPSSSPAELHTQRLPQAAAAGPTWQGPLTWGSRTAPAPEDDAPKDRRAPEHSVPAPAPAPEPSRARPPAAAQSARAAAETSVDLPPVPAAADETSVDLKPVPAGPDTEATAQAEETAEPPPASGTAADTASGSDTTSASGTASASSTPFATLASSGTPVTPEPEASAEPDPRREVSVVPGVPRYHDAHCILIRFMSEDGLETMTLAAARDSGCTPCRACQPDKPGSSEPAGTDTVTKRD
jgi:hypothetical protein